MLREIKIIIFSLIVFAIFVLYFFSEYQLNFIKENIKDTYQRFRVLTINDKTYNESSYGKFNFLYQVDHEKYSEIRNRYKSINNFEFHPYWSLEKSSVIYNNKNPIFRVSNMIKDYLTSNNIDLINQCKYYDAYHDLTQLTNNNQNIKKNIYKVSSVTIKPELVNNYHYIIMYSHDKKISEILINPNDNWNPIKSDYSPIIYNSSKSELVFDSYYTRDHLIKLTILNMSEDLNYEIYTIEKKAFTGLINNQITFEKFKSNLTEKITKVISHQIKNYPCTF